MYNNNVFKTMKNIVDPILKITDKKIAIFLSVLERLAGTASAKHP
jgi:hypothetical protein